MIVGNCRSPAASSSGGRYVSSPGSALATAPDELRGMNLATTTESLETGGFTNVLHRKPSVTTPAGVNTTPNAIGSQADTLVTLTARGCCDQPLQVPRVQEASMATTSQEKVPSVKGSMKGATRDRSSGMGNKLKSTKENLRPLYIPKRPKEIYRLFLNATPKEIEQRTLDVLKCKLCPEVNFTTWDHFTRHCRTSEAHPLQIVFCSRCGDFFTRRDVLERHRINRASECSGISQDNVDTKCNETRQVHQRYKLKMKDYLRTNQMQEKWRCFADVMKDRYPDSSKKRRR
jgi:hypothetical protein